MLRRCPHQRLGHRRDRHRHWRLTMPIGIRVSVQTYPMPQFARAAAYSAVLDEAGSPKSPRARRALLESHEGERQASDETIVPTA